MLVKKGILKNRKTKTYDTFTRFITSDFISDPSLPVTMNSSDYVKECWRRYVTGCKNRSKALNGSVFETIIATELYRQQIKPFYEQAQVSLVPNVDYDIILYDDEKKAPVALSLKTSTRERYKQADLEAVALKYVHRRAETYLVMIEQKEAISLKEKLNSGELLGINEIIEADSNDMDNLINRLKAYTLATSPEMPIIKGKPIK